MMLHLEPFQCSMSVWRVRLLLLKESPTAQTSLVETAATLVRPLPLGPGFGLVTMLQVEPFQCSMSIRSLPPLGVEFPTAQTSVVETAVTPTRTASDPIVGLDTTFHLEPFQCSMSVRAPPLLSKAPTAQTLLVETAATL